MHDLNPTTTTPILETPADTDIRTGDNALASMIEAIKEGQPISFEPPEPETDSTPAEPEPEAQPVEPEPEPTQPEPDSPVEDEGYKRLEDELAKVTRRHQSDQGRINALRSRLEQRRTPATLDSPELKQVVEEFPEIGNAIQKSLETTIAQVNETLADFIEPHAEDLEARQLEEFSSLLETAKPGYGDTVRSPAFTQWFERQAPGIRQLAASRNPLDGYALLQQFDHFQARSTQVDQVIEQRRTTLQDNTTTRSTPRGAALVDPNPDDALAAMTAAIQSGATISF